MNCPKCGCELKLKMDLLAVEAAAPAAPAAAIPNPKPASTNDNGLGALLVRIDLNGLNDAERKFIEETRQRFAQYGANTKLSEKQVAWLKKIAGKWAA